MNEYDQSRKENFFIFGDLKYENNAFLTQFRKIQSLNPNGLLGNSQAKIDSTFNDLIKKYKARGYEIPDFSVKNNLFEMEPLLLSKNRIHEYFSHQNKESIAKDTNYKFLENINNEITIRMNNKNSKTVDEYNEFINFQPQDKEIMNEMKKEIKSILIHNNKVKNYFDLKNKEEKKIKIENKSDTVENFKQNASKYCFSNIKLRKQLHNQKIFGRKK